MSESEWLTASIGSLYIFLTCLFDLYWTKRLFVFKDFAQFNKRYGNITVGLSIAIVFFLFAEILRLFQYAAIDEYSQLLLHSHLWLSFISSTLFFYFTVHFTKFTFDASWKVIIDSKGYTPENNWFATNKATYGNKEYLTKRLLILCAIFIIFRLIVRYAVFSSF